MQTNHFTILDHWKLSIPFICICIWYMQQISYVGVPNDYIIPSLLFYISILMTKIKMIKVIISWLAEKNTAHHLSILRMVGHQNKQRQVVGISGMMTSPLHWRERWKNRIWWHHSGKGGGFFPSWLKVFQLSDIWKATKEWFISLILLRAEIQLILTRAQ